MSTPSTPPKLYPTVTPTAPAAAVAWPVSEPFQETVPTSVPIQVYATSNPPPGVPDGGVWGKTNTAGGITWLSCAVMCILGGPLLLFGLPAFCCPCDETEVYLVRNQIYNYRGEYLGQHGSIDFRPMPSWGPTATILS